MFLTLASSSTVMISLMLRLGMKSMLISLRSVCTFERELRLWYAKIVLICYVSISLLNRLCLKGATFLILCSKYTYPSSAFITEPTLFFIW